ncbi:MAG: UvrB/UvrC motif-containing protein [Clostridia bacterium]|nr:UvrB/UvrC motif-containing protein [Clostridia bacterium]
MSREIERVKALMKVASEQLDFEKAIVLRDELNELKRQLKRLG